MLSRLDKFPSCLKGLLDDFDGGQGSGKTDLSNLIDLFVTSSNDVPSLSVVLDGFDECELPMREGIIDIVGHLYQAGIKVCVTTQSWLLADLTAKFEGASTLLIRADKCDVEEYIAANLPKKGITEELRREIINKISSEAEMCVAFSPGSFAY